MQRKRKRFYECKMNMQRQLPEELLPIDSSVPGLMYATNVEQTGLAIVQGIDKEIQRVVLTPAQLLIMIKELEDAYDAFLRLKR